MTQLRPKAVRALAGHRVVQVACGSRDAQTLALTDEGMVFSWGDGDFGKLGRGGSVLGFLGQRCMKSPKTRSDTFMYCRLYLRLCEQPRESVHLYQLDSVYNCKLSLSIIKPKYIFDNFEK